MGSLGGVVFRGREEEKEEKEDETRGAADFHVIFDSHIFGI